RGGYPHRRRRTASAAASRRTHRSAVGMGRHAPPHGGVARDGVLERLGRDLFAQAAELPSVNAARWLVTGIGVALIVAVCLYFLSPRRGSWRASGLSPGPSGRARPRRGRDSDRPRAAP